MRWLGPEPDTRGLLSRMKMWPIHAKVEAAQQLARHYRRDRHPTQRSGSTLSGQSEEALAVVDARDGASGATSLCCLD
jgi:hypothetical protein